MSDDVVGQIFSWALTVSSTILLILAVCYLLVWVAQHGGHHQ